VARKLGRDSPIAWRGSVHRTAEYDLIAFAANDATDGRDCPDALECFIALMARARGGGADVRFAPIPLNRSRQSR
jgi:hypothetical protein